MDNIQDLFFGKMSQEHSVQTKEKTSVKSCNRFSTSQNQNTLQFLCLKVGTMPGQFWETVAPSHGDFLTLNFGESPKDAEESFLWQILEGGGGRFNPVLFEPKGMYGNFGTLQKAWKETSKDFRKGTHCTNRQILIEQHARDSRYKECDTSPCLKASSGTGGNNQPFVVSETVTFSDVHGTISAADGPKGIHSQIQKDPESFFVGECYNVCSAGSNTSNMAYKTDVSKTLDLHSISANCNQGGTVCIENFTMSKDNRQTEFLKDTAFPLYATDYKDPQAVVCHNYSLSKGLRMQKALKDVSHPCMNSDYKDPQVINDNMNVRRLTPLEYCRLQGFPDYWTETLETENPTEEDMTFWRKVFKTYSEIYEIPMKSDKQIVKWLKNPFTDSAAYKMWGNGVALPVVFYILNTLNNYVQKEN